LIAALQPNQKATLQIVRDGNIANIAIIIGKRPKPVAAPE